MGEFFQVEFGVAGDDGEEVFAGVGVGEEGFEDLFGGQADLAGYGDGGEVVGVDLVGAQFVGDAEAVEEAGGVGLGWWLASLRRPPGATRSGRCAW